MSVTQVKNNASKGVTIRKGLCGESRELGRNRGKGMNGCVVRINRLKLKYHFVEKTRFEERAFSLEWRPDVFSRFSFLLITISYIIED